MLRSYFHRILFGSAVAVLCGCSSIMTHTGGEPGYYTGTRASYNMLKDDKTSWGMKPLAALDLPFSAIMDTVLLPWDAFRTDKSVKNRVKESEDSSLFTNSVIPPAKP
ncbi:MULTISPECIES: YceK/YidQ family lipoprotein [Tenebrionibacter/Tenebrionicola group]|uniref:YceK/YidQ family lipoprotein n=2 Tax=Tenebrionibacter/Tenebrionicola group TaxID=2969848 RepID=A0A8K0V097_9ENTR|nr:MULTISPECIES: YceK/YidQ family lipoprotein [Tenebrionibacter/Tenebrionicola group]MBK4714353.1 YceK/YidQ family lipoprotein [Tenebrionibacter intestinalis]MBV4414279.1 YceK/YidQ family lipoprotein [Tenebrionicola larvae]MBV5095240.1 YceK/YidQ family lipoprotein [Tenebrionicola larvae]